MTDEIEYPVFLEYEAPPSQASMLEQHLHDKITGESTSAHDVMYGRTDSSAAPDIESKPDAGFIYGIREDGDVFLAGVAVEEEGLVYEHDDFDAEAYAEAQS